MCTINQKAYIWELLVGVTMDILFATIIQTWHTFIEMDREEEAMRTVDMNHTLPNDPLILNIKVFNDKEALNK